MPIAHTNPKAQTLPRNLKKQLLQYFTKISLQKAAASPVCFEPPETTQQKIKRKNNLASTRLFASSRFTEQFVSFFKYGPFASFQDPGKI